MIQDDLPISRYLIPETLFPDKVTFTCSRNLTGTYLLGDMMVNFMGQFCWAMVPRYVLKHYSLIGLHIVGGPHPIS